MRQIGPDRIQDHTPKVALSGILPGIFGGSLAEALSKPISYELPSLVRLVGLDMLGAALSNGENSQLFIG